MDKKQRCPLAINASKTHRQNARHSRLGSDKISQCGARLESWWFQKRRRFCHARLNFNKIELRDAHSTSAISQTFVLSPSRNQPAAALKSSRPRRNRSTLMKSVCRSAVSAERGSRTAGWFWKLIKYSICELLLTLRAGGERTDIPCVFECHFNSSISLQRWSSSTAELRAF